MIYCIVIAPNIVEMFQKKGRSIFVSPEYKIFIFMQILCSVINDWKISEKTKINGKTHKKSFWHYSGFSATIIHFQTI